MIVILPKPQSSSQPKKDNSAQKSGRGSGVVAAKAAKGSQAKGSVATLKTNKKHNNHTNFLHFTY